MPLLALVCVYAHSSPFAARLINLRGVLLPVSAAVPSPFHAPRLQVNVASFTVMFSFVHIFKVFLAACLLLFCCTG